MLDLIRTGRTHCPAAEFFSNRYPKITDNIFNTLYTNHVNFFLKDECLLLI